MPFLLILWFNCCLNDACTVCYIGCCFVEWLESYREKIGFRRCGLGFVGQIIVVVLLIGWEMVGGVAVEIGFLEIMFVWVDRL